MRTAFLVLIFALSSVALQDVGASPSKSSFVTETLVDRDDVIWGFDFLPDGRILFTEKSGRIYSFDTRKKSVEEIKGAPRVKVLGQGGLLDLRVHYDFEKSPWIYVTFSEATEEGATTSLGRGRLIGNKLEDFKILLSARASSSEGQHFGSRIVFDRKGHVFFSIGDRGTREKVQDLGSHIGKTLRLNEDGSVPQDNPFVNRKGALPEIWSLGHRNPQGFVRNPQSGELWLAEMGPRGGDELNRIEPGKNYGWPLVTKGREYWGGVIGEKELAGMTEPVAFWVPSISPSGISFYFGDLFPQWKGSLFLGNLSGQHIRRLILKDGKVVEQEELLKEKNWRFRNLRQGPEGALYFSTDDGKIGRLMPVK